MEFANNIIPGRRAGTYYIDLDRIRLVVEDGKIVGWYRP